MLISTVVATCIFFKGITSQHVNIHPGLHQRRVCGDTTVTSTIQICGSRFAQWICGALLLPDPQHSPRPGMGTCNKALPRAEQTESSTGDCRSTSHLPAITYGIKPIHFQVISTCQCGDRISRDHSKRGFRLCHDKLLSTDWLPLSRRPVPSWAMRTKSTKQRGLRTTARLLLVTRAGSSTARHQSKARRHALAHWPHSPIGKKKHASPRTKYSLYSLNVWNSKPQY